MPAAEQRQRLLRREVHSLDDRALALLEQGDGRRIGIREHGRALQHAREHLVEIQCLGEVDELAGSPELVTRPPQLLLDFRRGERFLRPARLGPASANTTQAILARAIGEHERRDCDRERQREDNDERDRHASTLRWKRTLVIGPPSGRSAADSLTVSPPVEVRTTLIVVVEGGPAVPHARDRYRQTLLGVEGEER